jgi:hypothetical protein
MIFARKATKTDRSIVGEGSFKAIKNKFRKSINVKEDTMYMHSDALMTISIGRDMYMAIDKKATPLSLKNSLTKLKRSTPVKTDRPTLIKKT